MAYFDGNRAAPFGAITIYRIVRFFDGLIRSLDAWRAARATDRALRQLSDRELDDLGLSRGMIEDMARGFAHRR